MSRIKPDFYSSTYCRIFFEEIIGDIMRPFDRNVLIRTHIIRYFEYSAFHSHRRLIRREWEKLGEAVKRMKKEGIDQRFSILTRDEFIKEQGTFLRWRTEAFEEVVSDDCAEGTSC